MSITVRKLKLIIVNSDDKARNNQYKFIRDSQYAQYQALNLGMGYMMAGYLACNRDIKSEEFKEWQKGLKNSNPVFQGIEYGKGIDTLSAVTQKIKKDFSTSLKNGLAKGERSSINYKRNFPLMTRGRNLNFYEEDGDIFIKWVNKILFKVVFNKRKENTIELQHTLNKVINGEYKVSQSSLEFDRNNNLILNLTMDIPFKKQEEFVEGRVLGVDLGIAVPAYVCLSDDTYKRKPIGSYEDFFKVRKQFKERRERFQRQLKMVKGGKGRNKKLQALNSFREKERNYAKTYNHNISKMIIDFAKQHKCKQINIENLSGNSFDEKILSSWSYYELQQMITYKAERIGINVKKVEASYTSQTCSRCGHIDKENRQTQDRFKCIKCDFELNADHNAAINIARSNKYVK